MENFQLILAIVGLILILIAYLRFITDTSGNVHLNNYRLTGGILIVLSGLIKGTIDIFKLSLTRNCFLALTMYSGILIFYFGLTFE